MTAPGYGDPLPELDRQVACFTLDLENDWYFEESGYDHLTFEYIDDFIALLQDVDIPVTVFAVGETLEKYPDHVRSIQEGVEAEFHIHSYQHDLTKSYEFAEELRRAIDAYRDVFGRDPIGFRAPQGNILSEEIRALDEAGFEFDSSVFPTYRPGVYNNLRAPTKPYRPTGTETIVEYPIGVLPRLRIPVSQSYLKLFGRPYLSFVKQFSLPDVLVIDSHLQDFYRTASHENLATPLRQIHNRNLDNAIELFRSLIEQLILDGYEFTTMTDLHHQLISQ